MKKIELKKATRKQVKLRMGIAGVSGSGKTMSALLLAFGITNDWSKIAIIDTENGSASLYAHLGEFLTVDLQAPYSPERYIESIKACEAAGIEVIVLDSNSHEWAGIGGCLEINDAIAKVKYKGNTWSAWNETTPRHDRYINTILQSNCHVIACSRSKMETVMGDDKKVKKVGMKDIQREGLEYEWTIAFNIDRDSHMASCSKDRTELFINTDPFLITEETGRKILEWCNKGEVVIPVKEVSLEELQKQYHELCCTNDHAFSKDEVLNFVAQYKEWDINKLERAMAKVKTLLTEREDMLHAQQAEAKV